MSKPVELSDDKLFAISLAYECPYKWSKMNGDDRVRFCKSCQKNVYNISKMSRNEAVKLISTKEGDLCVRFYERRDGTVVTQECSSILGLRRIQLKFGWIAMINASLACIANILMPMLGPAFITIRSGGMGPIMASPQDNKPRDPDCDKEIEPELFNDD